MKDVTLGVVTYNSPDVVRTMLLSLWAHSRFEGTVVLVNNGEELPRDVIELVKGNVLVPGRNVGWEGGVNLALAECRTRLFCMANDDLLFVPDPGFWWKLAEWLESPEIVASAPSSNYVSGAQNAFATQFGPHPYLAPYLIGMLALYKSRELRDLGGVDEGLPGGDDIDLSIRARAAGFGLVAERRAYVHHVGSVTGRRERPDWDSRAHQMRTVNALVRKHGLARWWEAWCGVARRIDG